MRARTTASGSAMRASDSAADIGEGGGGADDCARGSSARMQSIALEDSIAIVIPETKFRRKRSAVSRRSTLDLSPHGELWRPFFPIISQKMMPRTWKNGLHCSTRKTRLVFLYNL